MGFVAPLLLLGGLAIGVPIALHFFYKARYRPLPWAAMDFLRQAIEQTSKRVKFQELLLLLLRCLVLLLLAFALARPTMRALSSSGRGESIDAVFVFDTSYSMGARDGDATRLDRAKEAAVRVIDELPPNSTVQVYTCSDRVVLQGPVTPGNLDQAREVVKGIQLTSTTGDVLPGLTEAYTALDRGVGTNKEVYLFCDLQKSGWDGQAGALKAKAAEIKQRATLILVRCGNPERPVNNVALADMTYPGGIPHTNSRLPVTVMLKNTGKNPLRKLTVTLQLDNKAEEKETAEVDEIQPGQSHPVTLLTPLLKESGTRLLTAKVSSDDLPGDDQLDRLIPVRDQVRVLIVDGSPDPRDPKQSASHYLRNALIPVQSGLVDEYYVRVTVVPVEEAGPALLGVADICFLCNVSSSDIDRPGVPGLNLDFLDRLAKFVRDGGGLVIGVGDNVVPSKYNQNLGSGGFALLPFDLGEVVSAQTDRPIKPGPDTTHPGSYLARFREDPYRTTTADAEVSKLVTTNEADNVGGRVLMRLADGKPWIVQRVVGSGEVVLLTTSLDATWSNWPSKGGSFVSFVQLTLSHLTGKSTVGVNRVAGEPLVYTPPEATKAFDVIQPDKSRVKLGKAQGGDEGRRLNVTVPETSRAGIYQIVAEGEEPLSDARFAVATDLRESDNLESLTDSETEDLIGFKPVMVLAGGGEDTLTAERSRREWTIWVLLFVFLFAVGESVWAWFCGRAW